MPRRRIPNSYIVRFAEEADFAACYAALAQIVEQNNERLRQLRATEPPNDMVDEQADESGSDDSYGSLTSPPYSADSSPGSDAGSEEVHRPEHHSPSINADSAATAIASRDPVPTFDNMVLHSCLTARTAWCQLTLEAWRQVLKLAFLQSLEPNYDYDFGL
ncbi:hypothetical protein RI367_001583 [Sorochytrium milnesiophthora]